MGKLPKTKLIPEKYSDILRPGAVIDIAFGGGGPIDTRTYILLDFTKSGSFMKDGCAYSCNALDEYGASVIVMIHEKELQGIQWYASRIVKFL